MKRIKNVGTADRILRVVISAVIVSLVVTKVIGGPLAAALLALSAILAVTALVGFCPLYNFLGMGSRENEGKL